MFHLVRQVRWGTVSRWNYIGGSGKKIRGDLHNTRFTTYMKVSMVCLGYDKPMWIHNNKYFRIFGWLTWRIVSALMMTGRVLRKVGGSSLFQVCQDRPKNDPSLELFFLYHPQCESPKLGARIFRKMESTAKVSQAAKRIMHCENHSRGCMRVCGLRTATKLNLMYVSPSFTRLITSFWGLILLSFFKMCFIMCSLMVAYQKRCIT